MTTNEDYKEYFLSMLAAEPFSASITDLDKYINKAIKQGIKDMWYSDNWSFRYKADTLTIASGATSTELPKDFTSVISFRENVSQRGRKLVHKSPEEFDRVIPDQSTRTGTPTIYKLFMEENNKKLKWYVTFFPQPDASFSLQMLYLVQSPKDVSDVPLVAHAAMEACIAKHIYPYSHIGRQNASLWSDMEIKKLAITSKSDQAPITFFMTGNDELINGNPYNAIP